MPQTIIIDPSELDSHALVVDPSQVERAAEPAQPGKRSLLDRVASEPNDIPLDSYTHATERGFANIGQGAAQAVRALVHPIDTAKAALKDVSDHPEDIVAPLMTFGTVQPALIRGAKEAIEHPPSALDVADAAGRGAGQMIVGTATDSALSGAAGALKPRLQAAADMIRSRAPLDNIADHLAETIAQDRARAAEAHSKGLGLVRQPAAQAASESGEALAGKPQSSQPTEPTGGTTKAAPKFTAADKLQAKRLLEDSLKQQASEIIDKAIPKDANYGTNLQTKAQIDFSLQRGDVAGAEKALDDAAKKANPAWIPLDRQPVPSTNEIRARLQVRPSPTGADELDTHALQQEMNQNLERHGWSAESEARREFIARNSTGVTKTDLVKQAGGVVPEKPVRYTKTPGVKVPGTSAPAAGSASDDLTDILQKSLEQAKARRKGK